LKHDKIVIGIDQSYTGSGISIGIDGKLVKVTSTNFEGLEHRSDKRKHLRNIIYRLLSKATREASQTIILVERIRTFSNFGNKQKKGGFQTNGLKPDYLKMTGALVAMIVDVAREFNVNVYSVDTRAWKSKIVGSSKARKKKGKRDAKSETVEYVQKLGFDLFIREKKVGKNKGEKIYDDDAADSACICLYGFLPKSKQNLKLEE
jgi:hypothetical protein